jgi:hypothetical protein
LASRSGYLVVVSMAVLTMLIVGCVTAQDIPDVEATVVVMLEEEKVKSLPTPLSKEARLEEIKAKTFPTVTPTPRPDATLQNPLLASTPTPIPPAFTPIPRPAAAPGKPVLTFTPTPIPLLLHQYHQR